MDYKYIKNEFISKHKQIDNYEYLERYINFLINYEININEDIYTENHHILPSSVFPEFKDNKWNIIKLKYDDHRLVHLWLFKSINIRKYQRPLNWMVKEYKNKEELSNASKRGWVNLKNNKEKYKDFYNKRSIHMKKLSSDEQRRRIKLFWDNISDDEYLLFCKKMKNYWTDDKKMKKSDDMNFFYSNPYNIIKKRIETKQRWDRMSDDERIKFREKMGIINKDENKRKLAGDKIKELWKDEKYLEKMKNRKHKPGKRIKLISQDNVIIFENMKDMVNKYGFSTYLIRKYMDTGVKIKKESLKKENFFLLNSIIESIKK